MKKFSTLSLILGIVGLITSAFLVGLFPCIAALIFGIIHIFKIRKSFGKSIAGIACAAIGLFISILIIIAIANPSSSSYNDISTNTTYYDTESFSNENDTELSTDKQTEPPTEKPTEKQTEPPTEKQTEKPTEKQTEPPTEKQTEKPTEKQTEPPTEKPTEKQTEPPTEKPTEKQTEPPTEIHTQPPQTTQDMVWIVENGTRYHCNSACSNMRAPYQVSKETAQSYGLTACKRCY